MENLYVHYGCGLTAPDSWINFDSSPTLRIQQAPVVGSLLKSKLNTTFPSNVRYGDVVKGLPIPDNSCRGIYCSHVLEHLSLSEFRQALKNTYRMLQKGGIFRCVVPDLETYAREYLAALDKGDANASHEFVGTNCIMGSTERAKGVKDLATLMWGASKHLWMWDRLSLKEELKNAGFIDIRTCVAGDSGDEMFSAVENPDRYERAVAMQCSK